MTAGSKRIQFFPLFVVSLVGSYAAKRVDGFATVQSFVSKSRRHSNVLCHASPNSSSESPLTVFNAWIDQQLDKADRVPMVNNPDDCAKQCLHTAPPPILDFDTLMDMAFASAIGSVMQEERRRFATRFHNAGGYCVVRLPRPEMNIVDDLWDCMEHLFAVMEEQRMELRHQTLTRQDTVEAHQYSGYEFFQTSLVDHSIPHLMDLVEKEQADKAARANHMLSVLGKAVASIAYAGVYDCEPQEASDVMSRLLDDDDKPFSGSFHRLAKYVPVKGTTEWTESLRSHGDWSLTTPIPVSSIAGLEIFSKTQQEWVRPELIARALWEREGCPSDSHRWNSRYVTVMAGKWMELLTRGAIETCIHRVVAARGVTQRLSAPYFMRPKPRVFEEAEALLFHEEVSEEAAVAQLCHTLRGASVTPGVEQVSRMAVDMVSQGKRLAAQ
jgi:hypothetical protein